MPHPSTAPLDATENELLALRHSASVVVPIAIWRNCRTFHSMDFLTLLLGFGFAGAATASASRVARRVSTLVARQPLDVDVAAERFVLDSIEADPGAWVRCANALKASDFTGSRRDQFVAIDARYRAAFDLPTDTENLSRSDADALVAAARDQFGVTDPALHVPQRRLMKAGRTVVGMGEGRQLTSPRAIVVETGDDDVPFRREPAPVPAGRVRWVMGGLASGSILAVPAAASLFETTGASVLAAAAASILVIGGMLLALVDRDVFLLDLGTFAWWLTITWALSIAAVAVEGDWVRLYGAFGAVGVVVLYEVTAVAFRILRGVTQGFGDTLIALVTAGVPAVLVGSWETGIHSAIAAGFAAGIAHGVAVKLGKSKSGDPIAFGPFLSIGAVLALALSLFGGN